MLTRDDGSNDGNLINYNGDSRKDLEEFLKDSICRKTRNILNLRRYFSGYHYFKYLPYKDDEYFIHNNRLEYFNGIQHFYSQNALILFDPDNGLEVKSMKASNGEKYLKYCELASIYSKMNSNSLIVVYQHIPMVNRIKYFNDIGKRIRENLGTKGPLCISDNVISFFIITKNDVLFEQCFELISTYANANRYDWYKCDDINCPERDSEPQVVDRFCDCGCGQLIQSKNKKTRYVPGHDAKHKSQLIKRAFQGDLEAEDTLRRLGW